VRTFNSIQNYGHRVVVRQRIKLKNQPRVIAIKNRGKNQLLVLLKVRLTWKGGIHLDKEEQVKWWRGQEGAGQRMGVAASSSSSRSILPYLILALSCTLYSTCVITWMSFLK